MPSKYKKVVKRMWTYWRYTVGTVIGKTNQMNRMLPRGHPVEDAEEHRERGK